MTDFAAIRAKLAKTKAGLKKAGTTISPKQGKNRYVILPPFNNDGDWHHNFGSHFIKDEADQLQAVYICNDRTHGDTCVVCNAMAEAQRTVGAHDPKVAETIKKAYAAQRFLVGVLALDSDQPDTPQVLQIGKKAFEQLVTLVEGWAEQVFDPANPQIIVIERSGTTQMDTSYTVQPAPNRHALKKALTPIDLADFVKQESEAAEKKAVLALKSIAGTAPRLAAPGASKDAPKLANGKPAADEFEDVPSFPAASAASKDVPAAVSNPTPAGAPSLDEDIDALLAGMKVE